MSFDIDVTRQVGERAVALRLHSDAGLVVLAGPSGIGKSSLLNMIAGLLRPARGHIRIAGETLFDTRTGVDVPPERRRVGYVFQDRRLFPHLRVRANLLYGAHDASDLDEVVGLLGIAPLLHRWPANLSGGEAQRVAIGRALLSSPRFLLLDEPLASLDPARRTGILDAILRIRDMSGLPILHVTHDVAEAAYLGAPVVHMLETKGDLGQGRGRTTATEKTDLDR